MMKVYSKAPLAHKLMFLNLGSLLLIFIWVHLYIFPRIETMFIDSYKTKIRNVVELADSILKDHQARVLKGELTEEDAKKSALKLIQNLRYSGTEYFWIHNLDVKMVMHATQEKLVGTDLTEKKDPNGLALFVEMNTLVKASGEGFLKYMWPKPGKDQPVDKYSYVKLFEPWGWVTGSGIYFDEIYANSSALKWTIYGGLGLAAILSCLATLLFSNSLVKSFRTAVDSLSLAGTEMSDLSRDLSVTGQRVSEGVSSSASSITETSASMEEIGLMSQKNADNSILTQSSADQCLTATREGKRIIAEAINCMDEISQSNKEVHTQTQNSSEKIKHIIQLIQGIGEKTKVIHDIVFQTKLLSFNASVEAARAGEAGKGFSIVAEEVGNLAEMSGKAAKEIQASLDESIHEVDAIVKENISQSEVIISSAAKKVNQGTSAVKGCEVVFDRILSQVTEVADLAKQISDSCHEQKIGFEQINKAVLQLNDTSNMNAKASVEVSSSVEKIVTQAEKVESFARSLDVIIKGNAA